MNTGYMNTGNMNTGNMNTGNMNTGNGNVGDFHPGSLCMNEAPFLLFDLPANRQNARVSLIDDLAYEMTNDKPIEPSRYLRIENATPERIKALHNAHIAARKKRDRR